MLWVNLIMDTCGALALATEPPSEVLLEGKPHKRDDNILNPVMFRNIIGQAIYQITVLIILLFLGPNIFGIPYDTSLKGFYRELPRDINCADITNPACEFDPDFNHPYYEKLTHYTIIFNVFVFMQIFNEINARKLGEREFNIFSGFFNNYLFIMILVGTLVI